MLVGLWGYAGSGKDTAAEALVADGWRREAFADRLRAMLYALNPTLSFVPDALPTYGWELREIIDTDGWDKAKRDVPEIRELLQRLGTEAGRGVLGENVWVDAVMNAWKESGKQPTVITDMRFRNEANAIVQAGGITVAIHRPDCKPVNGHVSETALEGWDFDFVINNAGTVKDLHMTIRDLVAVAYGNV